jgi:HTH-type transcriptional regulator/antitoxin HigA
MTIAPKNTAHKGVREPADARRPAPRKAVAAQVAPRKAVADASLVTGKTPVPTFRYLITNEEEKEVAITQLIALDQAGDESKREMANALSDALDAYEVAAGHVPEGPKTIRGILEVEMFKRRIRQRQLAELLEISEPKLSEIMGSKRGINFSFAAKLYSKLHIPADVIFQLGK